MPRIIGYVRCNTVSSLGLILSSLLLSSRYHTSAAYEQPILFSLFALIVAAALSSCLARFSNSTSNRKSYLETLRLSSNTNLGRVAETRKQRVVYLLRSSANQIRPLLPLFSLLFGCVAVRFCLFWFVVRTTQCSTFGVHAFLPFVVLLCRNFKVSVSRPPGSTGDEITSRSQAPHRRDLPIVYGCLTFVWGFVAVSALAKLHITPGTVCPPGWQWRPCVLSAQFWACFIDALLLVNISHIRRTQDPEWRPDVSGVMDLVPLVSRFVATLLVLPALILVIRLGWTSRLHWSDIKDLAIDSFLVAAVILCGISTLHLLHPASVAFLVSTTGLFGSHIIQPGAGILRQAPSSKSSLLFHLAAALLTGSICRYAPHLVKSPQSSTITLFHRSLPAFFVGASVLSIILSFLSSPLVSLPLSSAVSQLAAAADTEFKHWMNKATTSQNLEEAVIAYKQRYGLPPPPNFDMWYQFAIDNNSPVIDDFSQIHEDLFQFWAVEPATIRNRTSFLLAYSNLEMGGLRIRDGIIEQSPYVPGTHRWMMDSMQRMIEPFAKWLPDMDVAMNLADECRIAVPFEEVQNNKKLAKRAMAQMTQFDWRLQSNATQNLNGPQWTTTFNEPFPREMKAPFFTDYIRRQLYYNLVAPSCPPLSPARKRRWWDWSTVCTECSKPHSVPTDDGPLVFNTTLAHDLCHQPDMAYLDGFIMSPSAMVGTNMLFPVFSQGRVGGFSDILIPSPWNFNQFNFYNEAADVAWESKRNILFWRGSSSDGYAADGSWTGFLRARFVNEAYQRDVGSTGHSTIANVSFVGAMSRCHETDCDTELHTFQTWSSSLHATSDQEVAQQGVQNDGAAVNSNRPLPQSSPFDEHWQYRHLIDFDGAGFSGRFLPFLESRSLVYRAGLFHAWFDERLSAWHHYVPVDMRLGSSLWALLEFFSGVVGLNDSGNKHAEKIAEQGRDWAHKALRPEDMQIYMFRLLLEWGRIVDDNRHHLGFNI